MFTHVSILKNSVDMVSSGHIYLQYVQWTLFKIKRPDSSWQSTGRVINILKGKFDMSNIAQINEAQVSIVNFKLIPVVTTAMLADPFMQPI